MKVRNAVATALSVVILLTFVSCGGGGGAAGVLSVIPKGDYYQLSGSNPAAKYDSPFFKQIAEDVKKFENEQDAWEDRLKDMDLDDVRGNTLDMNFISGDAGENISYLAGRFSYDDLEDYFEDKRNWQDWNDDERNNISYYTGKIGTSEYAALLERGGLFTGGTDAVEDVIDVITKGKKRLVDDKDYNEMLGLVDFGATEFNYQWDNLDGTVASLKNQIRQIDDDEDLQDALDDLEAQGISVYWGNTLRFVIKWRFKKDKHLEPLVELLRDDMDEIFKKLGPGVVQGGFGPDADVSDLDELAGRVSVNRNGLIIEITAEFRWEDLEDIID